MSRLFSSDPVTKTKTLFHADRDGEGFVIETAQDVSEIAEFTQAKFNAFSHKSNQKFKGDGFHLMGSIPMTELAAIQRMCQGDEQAIDRAIKLWFATNTKFKAHPGKL